MKVLLLEALFDKEKDIVDSWGAPHHSFSDHAFGGTNLRTAIPLEHPEKESEHHTAIHQHLEKHGYQIHDYKRGLVVDKYGRSTTVGRALVKTKAPELLARFNTDPSRQQQSANEDYHVVISRHPHDVAGMTSAGHSWENQSCMNFHGGSNRSYLQTEVHAGTHVAYLVHKDDHEIQKPLARIALKPFKRHKFVGDNLERTRTGDVYKVLTSDHILRAEGKTYGNAPDAFSHTVNKWANKHFPGDHHSVYLKDEDVYDDTHSAPIVGGKLVDDLLGDMDAGRRVSNEHRRVIIDYNHNLTPEQTTRAIKHGMYQGHVVTDKNSGLRPHHLDLYMDHCADSKKAGASFSRVTAVPFASSAQIRRALDGGATSYHGLSHANFKGPDLDHYVHKVAADPTMGHLWTEGLASNPNLTEHHLDALTQVKNFGRFADKQSVLASALESSKEVRQRHIDALAAGANGENYDYVSSVLLRSPHLHPDIIHSALKHPNFADAAARSKSLKKEHMDAIVASPELRWKITPKHHHLLAPHHVDTMISDIESAHHDSSGFVQPSFRSFITNKRSLSKNHFDRLLATKHPDIHASLVDRPNLEPDEVKKLADAGAHRYNNQLIVHPHFPVEHMKHIAAKGSVSVKLALASNPNIPRDVWKSIALDMRPRNKAARRVAMRHPIHGKPTDPTSGDEYQNK